MRVHEELTELKNKLVPILEEAETKDFQEPIQNIINAIEKVGQSFSGSFIGYHSKVYYEGFETPPAWAQFSAEWGIKDVMNNGTNGDWKIYTEDNVVNHIKGLSNNSDLSFAMALDKKARKLFACVQSEALSILENEIRDYPDKFVEKIQEDIENTHPISKTEVIQELKPNGKYWSRDSLAMSQGILIPPHLIPYSEVACIQHTVGSCKVLSDNLVKLSSYLARKKRRVIKEDVIGTNIFLGHGGSYLWRELKDFIESRLRLPCDEFNRVPIAGITNVARLSEMLEASAFAFLILTAEDETLDGNNQARMNVIHEVGLFQGRLGFSKAIVLLEEGCAEFSNIQGLGQIRFPAGNIKASFEEVRHVLEREKLLT